MDQLPQPLEGITVVAVEQAVAAPFATRQLADLGARVIKVERIDGGDFAQGAAARLGLDAATLCAADPRLIAVDISGYGGSGPYADKRAYDMLVQCEAGLVSVTGTPERPVKAGIPAADIA